MENTWILAQAETQAPETITTEPVSKEQTSTTTVAADPNAATPTRQSPFGGYNQLIFIALIMLVFWMVLFRGPRKKQQEHKRMVQTLQKNDKIRTIGGILGTIVDIKGDEITLKVDESNNTKIKISTNAVGTKITDDKN